MDTRLTQHFFVAEFAQKSRPGFGCTRYPAEWIAERLKPLCEVLEVIRAEFGKPIIITSGYRSELYNAAIRGAKNSQHKQGRAVDIKVKRISPKTVHDTILRLYREKRIKIGGLGDYPTFTHLDIRSTTRLRRWSGTRTAV